MKKILILGAGFGGLETATGLAEGLDEAYEITLVDRSASFAIGFSKIDVLFGRASVDEVSFRYEKLRAERVRMVRDTITRIDPDRREVSTLGESFSYDYLVVALGAELDRAAVPGFVESGGHEFYSLPGAEALRPVLEGFTAGTLVLGILGMPYKCPPAPYEVACQIHDLFVRNGVRERITLRMVIPGPRPVKNSAVSDMLEAQLAKGGVELVAASPIRSIDAAVKKAVTDGNPIPFDLFVGVPVHVPPAVVRESRLGGDGWVKVDPETLETRVPDVFAVGDVTALKAGDSPVPKAGAFAEDAAKTVVSEILRREGFASERIPFQAKGACYFELGDGQVAKVDANYLGGPTPATEVSGPTHVLRKDKESFVTVRAERWFRE